ncbi:apyrase-like [Uranotaenia lowii]|uniref:apyrase-like n=1 Tax=Uranotaenia lowii TaxID=190385 RepID=UPI00247A37CB|nr:apyrase-like [Uranotaenia lowii]
MARFGSLCGIFLFQFYFHFNFEVSAENSQPILGQTKLILSQENCLSNECTLGAVVADAMADHFTNDSFRPLAMVDGSIFKKSIPKGDIRKSDVESAISTDSVINLVPIKKETIVRLAEQFYSKNDVLQVSGLKIAIDPTKAGTERILTVDVTNPLDKSWIKMDQQKVYYVAVPSHLSEDVKQASGGNEPTKLTGPSIKAVFEQYVSKVKVIDGYKAGRVLICSELVLCKAMPNLAKQVNPPQVVIPHKSAKSVAKTTTTPNLDNILKSADATAL